MRYNKILDNAMELDNSSLEHCFCSKDEALFFATKGKLFIIPWTPEILHALEKEGFKRTKMDVNSFSLYPRFNARIWEFLKESIAA